MFISLPLQYNCHHTITEHLGVHVHCRPTTVCQENKGAMCFGQLLNEVKTFFFFYEKAEF